MNVREVSESAGPTAEELDAVLDTLLWMASRPYDDPVEDAAARSYVWTLLQVEKRPRSQARSWAQLAGRRPGRIQGTHGPSGRRPGRQPTETRRPTVTDALKAAGWTPEGEA
jgi:hypothetical protein